MGVSCTANVMPSHAPELVSSNTSQAWANFCIQVPTIDTDCPMKKSRKLRIRRDANVATR